MRASNVKIQKTPVWNEIKNWDVEDKRMLITLLYTSIKDEEQRNDVEEVEVFADEISKDLLLQAGEYALEESRAGRCIPHAQAMEMIKERMGWK